MIEQLTTREAVQRRMKALENERSSWMSHWREINEVLLPRTGRFFATEENKGNRKNDILDDTATGGLNTLGSGMQYGQTSPSRPWMKIETEDTDLMEHAAVSRWCDQVTQKLLTIFARSNTYRSLHAMYEEIGAYGVAASIVLPDFKTIIHHTPLTIGEYTLGTNSKNEVDTLGRNMQMTVSQIVELYVAGGPPLKEKSGTWNWSRVSAAVKNAWDTHNIDAWIKVQQLIEPRRQRDPSRLDRQNMAWRNAVIEEAASASTVMHEGGFRRFPVVAPRWMVSGNDIYGSTCPGMRALGGIKQLQFEQLRKAQGLDYMVNPPLQVPTSLKNQDSDFLPGGVTYFDPAGTSSGKIESAFNVNLRLDHLLMDIQDVRQLINSAFYVDVFLMMDRLQGIQPRNQREVEERHEEKLLMLGPVVLGWGPFYWLLISFFCDVIFFSAALGYLIRQEYLEREQSLKQLLQKEAELQQKELEKMKAVYETREEERMRIARDLHDDMGSTLSSIAIYSKVVSTYMNSDQQKANEYLEKIQDNTKSLMDTTADLIWSLQSNYGQTESIFKRMQQTAVQLLSSANIIPHIAMRPYEQLPSLTIAAQKNIWLIFKEALNNTCKYSRATNCSITIEVANDTLLLRISDDGIGISINDRGNSNGLRNMQLRSEELGGNFSLETQPGKGATINCLFPVRNISIPG